MSNSEEKHSSDTDQAHGPQENLEHTSRRMKRCPRTMRTESHVVRSFLLIKRQRFPVPFLQFLKLLMDKTLLLAVHLLPLGFDI